MVSRALEPARIDIDAELRSSSRFARALDDLIGFTKVFVGHGRVDVAVQCSFASEFLPDAVEHAVDELRPTRRC